MVGLSVVGSQRDRPLATVQCRFGVTQQPPDGPVVVVGLGVIRLEGYGTLVGLHRAAILLVISECVAEIVVACWLRRIGRHCSR